MRRWGPQQGHGGNNTALAVADEADFVRVDFGAGLEPSDACLRVGGKVRSGGVRQVACGLAHSALVGAQNDDSLTGKIVR